MRKKLTLKFTLPAIEQAYQLNRIMKSLWMEKMISVLLLMYSLVRLITSLIDENQIAMYWEIGLNCYSIFLVVISFKGSPEKARNLFMFTSNLLCILQVYVSYYKYEQCIYMSGQNVMIFQMIMFYFSSFSEAPIQLLVFLISRALISQFMNGVFMGQDLVSIAITTTCILIFVYVNDSNQRAHFLLQFSDKQWEQTLPILIQSPFLMFTFDEERLNFNLKLCNDMQQVYWDNEKAPTENLRSFLREHKLGADNLEQYLVGRTRSASDYKRTFQIQLRICRNDQDCEPKKFLIRLSDFYLGQQVFLIVFDQNEQKIRSLEKVKDALIQGINQHQNLTINFLKKQLNLLQTAIKNKNSSDSLYKLQIHCMYFIGKYTQCNSFQEIEQQIQQINITDLIKELIHIYEMAYKHISIQFSSSSFEDIYVNSNEQLLNIFLVIIFQTFVRLATHGSTVFVHLGQQQGSGEEFQEIKIIVLFNKAEEFKQKLVTNQLFYKIQVRLSPRVDILKREDSCQFCIYKNLNHLNEVRMLEEEIQ